MWTYEFKKRPPLRSVTQAVAPAIFSFTPAQARRAEGYWPLRRIQKPQECRLFSVHSGGPGHIR